MKTKLRLGIPLLVASVAVAASQPQPDDVSLVQLIANPKDYDGKFVRLIGFVNLQFEGNVICLHEEDCIRGLTANCLWLDVSDEVLRRRTDYHRKYVLIEGTFNATNNGHLGAYHGAIEKISRWYIWSEPRRERVLSYVAIAIGLLLTFGACYRLGLKRGRTHAA